MVNEALKKFAAELKGIREKKAISLSEIHDKTRIDLKFLNEIENGNFSGLPDVYMRAFLKKYAAMLELEEDEVLSKYEFAKGEIADEISPLNSKKIELDQGHHEEVPETFDDFEDEKPIEDKVDQSGKNKNVIILSGLVLVSVVVILFYFLFIDSGNEEIVIEKPVEEILSERIEKPADKKIEVSENVKTSELKTSVSTQDSLSLIIQAVDTSWMRVMVDNKFSDEFILNPMISKSLKAKSHFSLLIGNSGGVELTLNGNKLPAIGEKGQIKNIIVDSSGIHYTRIK